MANRKIVINTLCKLTATGDEVDRCYASRALGSLKDVQAIPALIERLRDEDIDVSIDAVEALGRFGNPDTIPPLLESLINDPNGEVKTAVVEALGKIGGQDVIAPLLEIAKSCPDNMAWDDSGDWNDWWDMQLHAVEALGRMRVAEAVPVLAAILEDEEGQDIESEVLKALAMIGGEGEKVLFRRLTEGSPRQRRRAATALGFSNGAPARKALARAMTDKASEVRVAAIRGLGKLGASQYLDIILRFLKEPEPEVRRAVIEVTTGFSLTEDDVEMMRDKLAALFSDSSPVVRATALTALRDIGHIPQEMLEQIRQCLNDPDNRVVSAACTLFAHLGDNSVQLKLLQILSDRERDASLRSTAATALGTLGYTEVLGILSWAVADEAQPVRLAALNALMQLEKHPEYQQLEAPDKAARTPLEVVIAALKGEVVVSSESEADKASTPSEESVKTSEPSEEDSSSSEKTDSETPTIEPVMSTLEAIALDNAEVALLMDEQAEVAALPKNSEEFSDEVQEYVDLAKENIELGERLFVQKQVDVAADVRYLSARILGDSDLAVVALIEALNDDDPVLRIEVANSLGHIAGRSPKTKGLAEAFGSLVTHMNIDNQQMRLACARTLGLLANKKAIPALFAGLQDEESSVRTQMLQSLAALLPADAEQRQQLDEEMTLENVSTNTIIGKFVELLHDTDLGVRKAAASALAALRHKEALDSIIGAAFEDSGAAARDMGRALRCLDIEQSGEKLLKMLDSVPDSSHRRFVIEMLEEVFMIA